MTTNQALKNLLYNDELYLVEWLRAGKTKAQRTELRRQFKKGEISAKRKDALLLQFSFKIVQQMTWNLPKL